VGVGDGELEGVTVTKVVLGDGLCVIVVVSAGIVVVITAGDAWGACEEDDEGSASVREPIIVVIPLGAAEAVFGDKKVRRMMGGWLVVVAGAVLDDVVAGAAPLRIFAAATESAQPTYTPLVSFIGSAKHDSPVPHVESLNAGVRQFPTLPWTQAICPVMHPCPPWKLMKKAL